MKIVEKVCLVVSLDKMEDNIMTLEEFVFNVPLYHEITLNNGYKDIIEQLRERSQRTTIDGYNSIQRKESTFYLAKGLGDYRAFHS